MAVVRFSDSPLPDASLRSLAPRQRADRFEWHCTRKHGSWLDVAESELGTVSSQCLRILDKQILVGETSAWEEDRNLHRSRARWRFSAEDACGKLAQPYPSS
ncbi:MAG: hypothetical protein ACREC9_07330 [Methylocella sp.]